MNGFGPGYKVDSWNISQTTPMDKRIRLDKLTWPEVADLQRQGAIVVIPTGSTEQHGWHLPLETDSRLASEVAYAAALEVYEEMPVLLAPTLSIGVSGEHMPFAGTLTLSAQTFMQVAEEVTLSLIAHGFERIVFLNGHAGNTEPLTLVVKAIREKHDALLAVANYWMLAREALVETSQSPNLNISHGGEIETALMLWLQPDKVNMKRAQRARSVVEGSRAGSANPYLRGSLTVAAKATYGLQRTDLTPTGNTGDPTRASTELGHRFFEAIVSATAGFFRYVSTWPVPQRQVPQGPPNEAEIDTTEEKSK